MTQGEMIAWAGLWLFGAAVDWEHDGWLALLWPTKVAVMLGIVVAVLCMAIHRGAEVLYGLKNWND